MIGDDMRRRGLFQIHLSTAIVVMIAASSLLWLNLRGTVQLRLLGSDVKTEVADCYGWPYPVNYVQTRSRWRWFRGWNSDALFMDIMIGMTILLGVTIIMEIIVRHIEHAMPKLEAEVGEKKSGKRDNGERKEEHD